MCLEIIVALCTHWLLNTFSIYSGSGKTAAFVIPMLEKLVGHSPTAGVRAVILSPTRELCQQTDRVVREMSRFTDLVTGALKEHKFRLTRPGNQHTITT